ncbi:MAG: aldo/keto reductase [Dehalococcoidia bacterium]
MSIAGAGTVQLGDLSVPRFGYGTMRLPGPGIWGPPADRDEAIRVLRRAVELGVRVLDTAWYYGWDIANELVAAALQPYPDDLVLVTKLGGARRGDGSWYSDLSPAGLRAGCERDLRVLGVDSIPVTHLRWSGRDADEHFEQALQTMLDLQREGRIQRIGLSNVSVAQLDQALRRTAIVSVSNPFSLTQRTDESTLERCEREGIAYLPFFPLAAGAIGRQEDVEAVARQLGLTPVQIALAWLLARSPFVLPIPGTSSVAHLEENIASADIRIPAESLQILNSLPAAS